MGDCYGAGDYHRGADRIRLKADRMYKAEVNKANGAETRCKNKCSETFGGGGSGGTEMSVTFDAQNIPAP